MTDHKEKTALMQAIEEIEKESTQVTEPYATNLKILADSIRELLPKEREQMRKVFEAGSDFVTDDQNNVGSNFETYYNETYGE